MMNPPIELPSISLGAGRVVYLGQDYVDII